MLDNFKWFITGYTDGDGTFSISISKDAKAAIGYTIKLIYQIGAENTKENENLLRLLIDYFGSIIFEKNRNVIYQRISAMSDLIKVRKHFDKYPLQSSKIVSYQQWCKVMDQMLEKKTPNKRRISRSLSY